MPRQRKRPEAPEAELSMTPMIDVVFQLLIYFIVTIKPIDVITNLDVFRPAPDPNAPKDEKPPQLVRLGVYQDGYSVNDNPVSIEALEKALGRLAAIDAGQTIMITVSAVAEHGKLINVLDLCAKNGLRSLSVVSASN
ncbi:MAG: biopolymer transporter ExbD [Kiritimatiellae bacterium]|nr:biopolymer transporter ExbD [Kiritimatiellia bacterium]MDD4341077.1 biopolymer transporter ExbD [Kiritimatiellia bacterium]MDY0148974.1 biopolymer transporter ExbD [Kiritimatiellia bacterium]